MVGVGDRRSLERLGRRRVGGEPIRHGGPGQRPGVVEGGRDRAPARVQLDAQVGEQFPPHRVGGGRGQAVVEAADHHARSRLHQGGPRRLGQPLVQQFGPALGHLGLVVEQRPVGVGGPEQHPSAAHVRAVQPVPDDV